MIVAGIDYSLRGPAICIYNGDAGNFSFKSCSFHFLTNTKKYATLFGTNIFGERFHRWDCETERYETIADWACDKLTGCEQVALEGYAFGAKGNRLFQIAENTGVLKYKLYHLAVPIEIVAPSEVKKFATDKGNASKADMHSAFHKRTNINLKNMISPNQKDISNPVSDIVDSYYICRILHHRIVSIKNGNGC
tara:strand:+ start:851 stop:1429 length:579 start_codon:yes stop_codon:yes gene_type:complete